MSRADAYRKNKKNKTSAAVSDPSVHTHTHRFSLEAITGRKPEDDSITTYVDRVSQDQRRRYREEVQVGLPSPIKRARLEAASASLAHDPEETHANFQPDDSEFVPPDRYEVDLGFEGDDEGAPRPPRVPREVKPSDPALHRFRARRGEYLTAFLRRDGCGNADAELCRVCREPDAACDFRCRDCHGDDMLCGPCMVDRHVENPLHRVEKWECGFFHKWSLKALGLRVQLGHPPRQRCPQPHAMHSSFVVLHTNGIHEIAVDVCDCEDAALAGPPEIQMLRAGWFPATDDRPRTCGTFACLDLFLASTHQAKTTIYDFYGMLEKLTDNTGVKPPNRYHAFLRMCREYRHLLMLKRAGRGHEPSGIEGTKQGELAVLCPCCPRPGINLPEDWQNAAAEDQFLYILFLALDACFRLKRRLVSSQLKDPSLGSGWSYILETSPYHEYLLTVTDQKEMSTCSGLAALDYANTKFSRGYAATGVAMGVCARHEFVQPNGVGDLQKGERYANMDYIFASILRHKDWRLFKIISYDIVCQWWVNLKARLKLLPPLIRLRAALELMRFVIPKMHIHGHTLACQLAFSLNYVPGSAQTDGEGIERPWAHIGGVASSTREMTPGARDDTLTCHWSHWNWQKLIWLAERLRTKLDRAETEHASQLEAFTTFSMQQAEQVPAWRQLVEDFEKDGKKKNPYQKLTKVVTEAQVRLQFEREEAARVQSGVPGIHAVSPSSFVNAGLEVEEDQRRVRLQAHLKKKATTSQEIDLVSLRRKLSRDMDRLRKLQATYTPAALVALDARTVPDDEPVERVPLFLPSALTPEQRSTELVSGLALIEEKMRHAQCGSALEELRNDLYIKSRLLTYKQLQARHQGSNTRARGIVTRNESRISLHSEKYQMAWEALKRLVGGDPGKVGWRVLRKEDIRCMEDAEEVLRGAEKRRLQAERRLAREVELRAEGELPPLTEEEEGERMARGGENVRTVSWIWTGAGTAGTDADVQEALQIEWAKAYARTRRWREETRLVKEEARRLPLSLEYVAAQWDARAAKVPIGVIPIEDAEGAVAYGKKQAAMYRKIAARVDVTMTEVRAGRGKRRRAREVWADDEMDVDGVTGGRGRGDEGDEDEIGLEEVEEELADVRGDISDDEHILAGGADDD
ncbi:hypothetical protein B0H11DRAFT_2247094 [Mycena galericulata]|nr:hypothetical protein B0H11DRAFT_2247094 [Mycena galericulata]